MRIRFWSAIAVAGVLLAGVAPPAWALDPDKALSQCSVDTWNFRNGVPGWVRALAQTPEGYLWVGTNTGLVRYGGGPVVPVEREGAAVMATDVMGLWPARDGTLWVTPARGGPLCARPGGPQAGLPAWGAMGELRGCLPPGQRLEATVRIADLKEDQQGAIWMATQKGIYRYEKGRLALVYPAATLPEGAVNALHPDPTGALWVGTTRGLLLAKAGNLAPHPVPGATDAAFVSAFALGQSGGLWVLTEQGLLRIDPPPAGGPASAFGGKSTFFPAAAEVSKGRPGTLVEDRDGNVWFGGRRGLTRFRPGTGFVTFTRADGLPEDDVTTVFEDREGSLWVGTRGGGIAQFTDRTLDGQAGPPALRHRWISAVAEDPSGALWVASRLGLVRFFEGEERIYTTADGLPSDSVLSVSPGQGDEVWIGTDRGLARWRGGRIDIPVPLAEPVATLYLDPTGILWLGGKDGLARLEDGVVTPLPLAPGLELMEIRGVQRDDRGAVWLSAGGRLLRVWEGRVAPPPDGTPTINKVRSLHRDVEGTLWLGTHEGLARFFQGRWRLYDHKDGLPSGDFYQVLSDDHGYLWAGTTRGLVRLSKRSLHEVAAGQRRRVEVVSFQASDQGRAVGAVRPRQPAAWKSRDGRLWFATSRGLVRVNPARLRVNTVPPTVRIEQALIDGRPVSRAGPNDFPPGAKSLEFHFAAITLIEPQKALHRYRLQGFDSGWVEAGIRRSAYYTNIPPGHYRFHVQGSNADGIWNESGDALVFSVAPRFFQTGWFYALGALGLLGLLFGGHRLRVLHLKGRYDATFAERTRVARELHDSLLQGMSATLLHVKAMRKGVSRAPGAPEPEAVSRQLEQIEGLIVSSMDETRRFVMDLREVPSAGVELGPAMEQMIGAVRAGASAKVDLHMEGTPGRLPQALARDVLRIVQEALANATRHAQARRIEVRVERDGERLAVSVRDDGRGFDPRQVGGTESGHFGLLGMRERAASIGKLSLESHPGRGTTVQVTIEGQKRHGPS